MTLYLSEDDVRRTLRGAREGSAPGSVLVADVYAERLLRLARGKAVRKTLDYTDEGLGFGLDFGQDWERTLRDLLESEGLTLGEACFMGRANPKGPFTVVAEFIVPAEPAAPPSPAERPSDDVTTPRESAP